MKAIIDGKTYELIPIEETEDILEEYKVQKTEPVGKGDIGTQKNQSTEIKDAIPQVSEYRERYKKRKIKVSEITAPPSRYSKLNDAGFNLDDYQYNGEKLFTGPGLEEEI